MNTNRNIKNSKKKTKALYMLLAKSCSKRHNVKNGTLRLGSLQEYRHTEIQEIADHEEGLLKFILAFDGDVKIKTTLFNTLNGGAIQLGEDAGLTFPGYTRANFIKLKFRHEGEYVTIRDSSANIIREDVNSFIFCMSQVRKMRDCEEIFPNYDDYWYIRDLNAFEFGKCIGREILATIKKEQPLGKLILPEGTDMNDLNIHVKHGRITYIPREIHLTNKNEHYLEELVHLLRSMAFIKPPEKFEKEREYRFQYMITSKNKIIQPIVKSLIIDSNPILNYII